MFCPIKMAMAYQDKSMQISTFGSAESLKVVKEREICTPKSPVKLHLIHKIYILNVQIAVLKVVTNLTIIILHIII